jgi:hypothetical protein
LTGGTIVEGICAPPSYKIIKGPDQSVESTTLYYQVVNKLLTNCQQAENKLCEHILLKSCWTALMLFARSLLQVCYDLYIFTCARA